MRDAPFLLDANAFIESHRRFDGHDICPGFWDFVKREFAAGHVLSLGKVHDELMVGGDWLSDWVATEVDEAYFVDQAYDGETVFKYQEVSRWVMLSEQFSDTAKRELLQQKEADPWLCAYAAVRHCVVVTHEVAGPHVKRRVPLPNVLEAFQVPYVDLFEYLKALAARFVLA